MMDGSKRLIGKLRRALGTPVGSVTGGAFWTLVLVAVAAISAINLQTPDPVATIHAIRWVWFLNATMIVVLIGVGVSAVTFALTRDYERSLRVAVLVSVAVFWFPVIGLVVQKLGGGQAGGILTLVLLEALVVVIGFLGKRRITIVLVSLAMLLVAVPYARILVSLDQVRQPERSVVVAPAAPSTGPNLLVLVLDGYPSSSTLDSLYNASGAAFADALTGFGFSVHDDAMSNHNRTYASVASMHAMEVVVAEGEPPSQYLAEVRGLSGGDGEFLRAFKDAGYAVTFSPPVWSGSRCGQIVDRCDRVSMTKSNFFWLATSSLLKPIFQEFLVPPSTDVSLRQLRGLDRLNHEALADGVPTVTWVHALMPHPPVSLNADCEVQDDPWRFQHSLTTGDAKDALRVAAFPAQVACVDSVVVEQLGLMLEADPNLAVLILSDHGPDSLMQSVVDVRTYDETQVHEKLSVLTAFRGPDRCRNVVDQESTILVMREVTRCLTGASVLQSSPAYVLVPHEHLIGTDQVPIAVDRP